MKFGSPRTFSPINVDTKVFGLLTGSYTLQTLQNFSYSLTCPDQDGYVIVLEMAKRVTLMKFIAKAFTQYWRITGLKRKVSFKEPPKNYETRLTAAIGEKAMFVKHTDDKAAIKHYLDKMELLKATKICGFMAIF
jgi:hypothetical protein